MSTLSTFLHFSFVVLMATALFATAKDSHETITLDVNITPKVNPSRESNGDATLNATPDGGATVTVKCTVDARLTTMEKVTGLTLLASTEYGTKRPFRDLASVDVWSQEPVKARELISTNVNVRGEIGASRVDKSYLQMSWWSARGIVDRTYKCIARGLTGSGQAQSISAVTEAKLNVDICNNLESMLEVVEGLDNKTDDIKGVVDGITVHAQDLAQDVESLKTELMSIMETRDRDVTAVIGSLEGNLTLMIQRVLDRQSAVLKLTVPQFDVSDAFKGKIYLVSKQVEPFDIQIADSTCVSKGGHLVEFDEEGEYSFIYDFVTKIRGANTFWTGANDIDQEGRFVYYHSKKLVQGSYVTWSVGEPNNNSNAEDCVEIRLNLGALNDEGCNNPGKIICEIP